MKASTRTSSSSSPTFAAHGDLPSSLGEPLEFLRLLWAVAHALHSTSKRLEATLGVTGPQRLGLQMVGYLGVFWLALSAVGYALNGWVDPPSKWYYVAAGVNIAAAASCYFTVDLLEYQYVIAAIVSVWSMLSLWIFRSDA